MDWISIIYNVIVYPLAYIFPAYVASGFPVIFGGGAPLDFKKKLGGRRILGDNKTIRGVIFGIVGSIAVGVIEFPFLPFMLVISVFQGIGAMFGDLLGSFIKRRMNLKPGAVFPLMDQYGFYIFALVFSFWLGNLPNIYGLVFITIMTGLLHLLGNKVAYMLDLKKVPW